MLADGEEFLSLILTGVGTVVLLVGALVAVGFLLIARRNRRGVNSVGHELETRAGSLLLQLDDQVRAGEDEVDFAVAQFGTERTRAYSDAVTAARADLTEGFRLRQLLDDAFEDSDRQRREWTLQIIANCERAQRRLTEQQTAFTDLRRQEVGAAATLKDVRATLDATQTRVAEARKTLATLGTKYAAERITGVAGNADAAESLLTEAGGVLDAAAPRVKADGVSDVSDDLQKAAQLIHRASGLLDDVDRVAADLGKADAALAELLKATTLELDQAKPQREQAPDADTGEAINEAIAVLQKTVAGAERSKDPVDALDRIDDAAGALDVALAGARNQQQRLAHARDAYAGAVVSARSQIAEAKGLIGGAGVEARTRLAEAERQLGLAEVASDPVEALDTARRAITLARDSADLARFDAM